MCIVCIYIYIYEYSVYMCYMCKRTKYITDCAYSLQLNFIELVQADFWGWGSLCVAPKGGDHARAPGERAEHPRRFMYDLRVRV